MRGGKTRNESIYNAIKYIQKNFSNCKKKVIFHDSARPFINYNIINNYVDLLEENDAVITAVRITDSIGKLDGEPIDRN
ncbi:2-C-methyl-D-erythritol 4-phosphate cytidylyltransferase [Tepidanaerobacter syntrophicus]|uniref:2-C-methyl-D-erythritol 4-phosphate cytidylyltransferase n=1 Tax=Tepidanaerobacter syntrophicus TaxID=224999 RepID=UPI003B5C474A